MKKFTIENQSIITLERYLPYRLSILSNKVSSLIAETYKHKFALSITEWRIMAVLGEYPGTSADEVSSKTQIEKSILSRALNKRGSSSWHQHLKDSLRGLGKSHLYGFFEEKVVMRVQLGLNQR